VTYRPTDDQARTIARRVLERALAELASETPDLGHVYTDVEAALIWLKTRRTEDAHEATMIGRK
jgi:hypothetical protein